MSLNITVTKKILEFLVKKTFSTFGSSSSGFLDSLKQLGFHYSTNAGISINIEDLRTPKLKKEYLNKASIHARNISLLWNDGLISNQERFQSILDGWHLTTEILKNKIVDYYQTYDPANNLYIMAFSGARGNMSQVRQLVGMRGLMSDQEGKIIDSPIQSNFREGLSTLDYIISSYGARKGIVDTALKTADSGYLTRRLIYLAQDFIVREFDCKTHQGILIQINKDTEINHLVGKMLISAKQQDFPFRHIFPFSSTILNTSSQLILTKKTLVDLKTFAPLVLSLRSVLTCKSPNSVCQSCYGWDLSTQKLIKLGSTIGVIAAQSVGEPGTQLTMRTFHTGGIFTGEIMTQVISPFAGKILYPIDFPAKEVRTNHGFLVLQIQAETHLSIINWQGQVTTIFLAQGSYVYVSNNLFVYKNQLIAELPGQTIVSQRTLKPILANFAGKIILSEPLIVSKSKTNLQQIILKRSKFSLLGGKFFKIPSKAEYLNPKVLRQKEAFARIKITAPITGFISKDNEQLVFTNKLQQQIIRLSDFTPHLVNCTFKIDFCIPNYELCEVGTILGYINIYPLCEGKILALEKVEQDNNLLVFIVTHNDTWKVYGGFSKNLDPILFRKFLKSEVNISSSQGSKNVLKSLLNDTCGMVFRNTYTKFILTNLKINLSVVNTLHVYSRELNYSFPSIDIDNTITARTKTSKTYIGNLLAHNYNYINFVQGGINCFGKRNIKLIQNIEQICLPLFTILHVKKNDFVSKNETLAFLVNYNQQTDDIVQGLPKIEEIIEARQPKQEAILASSPGTFIMSCFKQFKWDYELGSQNSRNDNMKSNFVSAKLMPKGVEKNIKDEEKLFVLVTKSFVSQECIIRYLNQYFELKLIAFSPFLKSTTDKFETTKVSPDFVKLIYDGLLKNYLSNSLLQNCLLSNLNVIFLYSKQTNTFVLKLNKKFAVLIQSYNKVFTQYSIPRRSKLIHLSGDFIDIGEPITEGSIDSHNLLQIFFNYYSQTEGLLKGAEKSINKFQLLLINSIQAIYQSQGVIISNTHIEILVRQLTTYVTILTEGDTPFLKGELIPITLMSIIYKTFKCTSSYKVPLFEPKFLSATSCSVNKDSFLAAAGFQETRKILTKAAIEGTCDWFGGLKESIITGRLMPAGSTFLNYKNNLDNIYQES
jgi:hypothetical protein